MLLRVRQTTRTVCQTTRSLLRARLIYLLLKKKEKKKIETTEKEENFRRRGETLQNRNKKRSKNKIKIFLFERIISSYGISFSPINRV